MPRSHEKITVPRLIQSVYSCMHMHFSMAHLVAGSSADRICTVKK